MSCQHLSTLVAFKKVSNAAFHVKIDAKRILCEIRPLSHMNHENVSSDIQCFVEASGNSKLLNLTVTTLSAITLKSGLHRSAADAECRFS